METLKTQGGISMALYIAKKMIEGRMDYKYIFGCILYKKYQADVDAILIGEGREDLIVPVD